MISISSGYINGCCCVYKWWMFQCNDLLGQIPVDKVISSVIRIRKVQIYNFFLLWNQGFFLQIYLAAKVENNHDSSMYLTKCEMITITLWNIWNIKKIRTSPRFRNISFLELIGRCMSLKHHFWFCLKTVNGCRCFYKCIDLKSQWMLQCMKWQFTTNSCWQNHIIRIRNIQIYNFFFCKIKDFSPDIFGSESGKSPVVWWNSMIHQCIWQSVNWSVSLCETNKIYKNENKSNRPRQSQWA